MDPRATTLPCARTRPAIYASHGRRRLVTLAKLNTGWIILAWTLVRTILRTPIPIITPDTVTATAAILERPIFTNVDQ